MTTVTLDDALQARIRAVAAPEEDFQAFIAAAAQDLIAHRERQAQERQAARAEAQALLNGPSRPFDAEATYRRYKERYDLPDLSHLSGEALIADTERLIAALPPEKRAATCSWSTEAATVGAASPSSLSAQSPAPSGRPRPSRPG